MRSPPSRCSRPRERRFRGSIVSALEGLADFAAFAPVLDWIDADAAPERAISELTRAFARVYLANARDPLTTIVFVHGVTSAAALRSLAPYLDAATTRELIRYALAGGRRALRRLRRARSRPRARPPRRSPSAESADRARAVAHGDDHAIKLTEACLREHALAPDPSFRAPRPMRSRRSRRSAAS